MHAVEIVAMVGAIGLNETMGLSYDARGLGGETSF
jgi:hypothetical protein